MNVPQCPCRLSPATRTPAHEEPCAGPASHGRGAEAWWVLLDLRGPTTPQLNRCWARISSRQQNTAVVQELVQVTSSPSLRHGLLPINSPGKVCRKTCPCWRREGSSCQPRAPQTPLSWTWRLGRRWPGGRKGLWREGKLQATPI